MRTLVFLTLLISFNFDASYFTDGLKTETESRVGFAVYSPENGLEYRERINDCNTIFEAEALAVQYGIDHISNNDIKNAAIFSDALSVLRSKKSRGYW